MRLQFSCSRLIAFSLVLIMAGSNSALAGASEVWQSTIPEAKIPVTPKQGSQTVDPQATPREPQSSTPLPQGTAAAPDLRPEGSPASRPAGAAIAAAKQKRSHSFAIRVGLLVGAGIAIGTVVALSAGSSSRPN